MSRAGIIWRWLLAGARLTVAMNNRWSRRCGLYPCFAGTDQAQLWRLLMAMSMFLKAVLLGGAAIPVELTEGRSRNTASAATVHRICLHGLHQRGRRADVGEALPGRE